MTTVYGQLPSPEEMTKGPKVEGIISARSDGRMQVTTADGNNTAIAIADYTKIKSSGGFLGLDRDKLLASQLLNGLPVEVDNLQWNGGLVERGQPQEEDPEHRVADHHRPRTALSEENGGDGGAASPQRRTTQRQKKRTNK